jgi:hypothetical protein
VDHFERYLCDTSRYTHTHKRTSPVDFANSFFLTSYEKLSSIRRHVANKLCFKVLKFIMKFSCFPSMRARHETLDKYFLIYMNHSCQPNFLNLSKICNPNCGHLTKLESGIFRPVSGIWWYTCCGWLPLSGHEYYRRDSQVSHEDRTPQTRQKKGAVCKRQRITKLESSVFPFVVKVNLILLS